MKSLPYNNMAFQPAYKAMFISFISIFLLTCNAQNDTKNDMTDLKKIPLEDFFKNPNKSNLTISPDGDYIAYLAPVNNRMNIHVQELNTETVTQITFEVERDVAGYLWATNQRILFLKDSGGDENYKLFGVDTDGQNASGLTDFDGVLTQIIDRLDNNNDEIIIGMNKRVPQIFDPYRLNINTGELTQLHENPGNISGWITDHEGKLRMASTTDGVNTGLLYRETEEDSFEEVFHTNFKSTLSPAFFTFDNKEIYALSNINRDKLALVRFDPKTGEEKELIFKNEDYDLSNASYSKKRKRLTNASYTSWKQTKHFFDAHEKSIYDFLANNLSEEDFVITSENKDENKFIVRTYSDKSRGGYYFLDWDKRYLKHIESLSPWIDEADMADMNPIQFQSRDSITLHGYLTLPKGYTMTSAKNLPLVVNPHGGPWARDSWGFNPEIQFLANQGYAVLQINFRGSTGYGKKFWEASFGQWGLSMQDDITDGVQWAIDKGIVDKDKIAIYGGSYGGYATLAGLAFTPELYACGVDYVGVSNLFTFMESIPPYWEQYLSMLHEMVGHPEKDKARLEDTSPALQADKIIAPLFVAQGANDPRVNKAESDQMVEALKARGVEVQYLVKDNEGHGFHNEENRFEFYRAMSDFLKLHIGQTNNSNK